MDTYTQLEMLTAVIANLPESGAWTERDVMETLLEVFETARPSRASRKSTTKPNGSTTTPFSRQNTKTPAKANGNG